MNRRYYDEEMRYLLDAGQVFAEEHPEVARYLNVDSIADRDPYVERLFEGFAFLTGRIREQLDDELPQYTEGLFQLLYPHFLKPLPACTIVELAPKPGLVQAPMPFERGLEVRSAPAGEAHTSCRFQTTQPVVLQPLRLARAELVWGPDEASHLRLRFKLERGADAGQLDLSRLRLYLHAEAATAQTLHLFLTRHVRRVGLGSSDAALDAMPGMPGQASVQPVGLAPEESLLPPERRAFSGFRMLQEYLCFPQKFWFVDLLGLDRLPLPDEPGAFDVTIVFDRTYPETRRIAPDAVRLYCTPAVNLFEAEAEPIRLEGYAAEYRLIPEGARRHGVEVYDVTSVATVEDRTGRRHTHAPFFAFRHGAGQPLQRYYSTFRRLGPTGRRDVFLTFGSPPGQHASEAETASVSIRATNGLLPHERLQEGAVRQLGPSVPQVAQPANLTKPTQRLYPPAGRQQDYFWTLVSHWSLNYLSLASPEALAVLLDLYDWNVEGARRRQNQRRLAGIETVRWAPKEMLHRSAVRRGAEVTLTAREDHFDGDGDLALFGLVLSTLLSRYATINAFAHLAIETLPSGTRYAWTPQRGTRTLL